MIWIKRMQRRIVRHFDMQLIADVQSSHVSTAGNFTDMSDCHTLTTNHIRIVSVLRAGAVTLLGVAERFTIDVKRRLDAP
jgi:hypothetical protein